MVKVSSSSADQPSTTFNSVTPSSSFPHAARANYKKQPPLSMAAVPTSATITATSASPPASMPATVVATPVVVVVPPSVAVVAPTARPPPQHSHVSLPAAQHPTAHMVLKGTAPPPPPQQQQQHNMKMPPPQTVTTYVTANRTYTQPPPTLQHQPHPAHMHPIGPGCPANGPPPQWPIVDPVFHFGPGFEHQHYCPTHSQGPQPHEHVVFFHVNLGVSVTFQIGGKRDIIRGPVTVPMVSQGGSPPIAMPVQVPPGHVMQQIVDESGTLRHVILSTAQHQQMHGGQTGGVQGVQSHMQGHYITANNTQPHYYSPLSAGLPGGPPGTGPPHYHALPPNHLHQPPMQHALHSPSPPNSNYHKDERTQRQHTKLLRKLDQKHREINSTLQTSATSLHGRKSETNGVLQRNKAPPTNGASSPMSGTATSTTANSTTGSTASYEDGDGGSSVADDEDEVQAIVELLSSVQSPQISEVTPRSALLKWTAPVATPAATENIVLNSRDLRYEVLLSDRGKEGKYKIIFKGQSLTCRIRDLRPGQEYSVCLQVYLEEIQGSASDAAIFTTPACEPDTPLPPKVIAKTKNSLQLRWNAPPDNGAHIQQYILEYDEGKGAEFVEVIRIKGKQYSLSKLQPSTWYNFRLAAVNECGRSAFCEPASFSTSGNPPVQLPPPILQASSTSSLRLVWNRRGQDEEYCLQLSDSDSGHGFLTCYAGRDTIYECVSLKRATGYQFRMRAENEAGSSPWSDAVTFLTQPERPGRPQKLHVKGKIHATQFKAKWDPPTDKGGADIKLYILQISYDGSGSTYETVYTGNDTEATCDRLHPGTTYALRIACEGPAGYSPYTDAIPVTTDAVVPAAPAPPSSSSPPGPYAAALRWNAPEYNGGAPIVEYELKVDGTSDNFRGVIAFKGRETYAIVKDLVPGERYEVQVRAFNRIGASGWSEPVFSFTAGAAAPFAPEQPEVAIKSSSNVSVSWNAPFANGAVITEYQLASACIPTAIINTSDDESDETTETTLAANTPSDEAFSVCYVGVNRMADIKHLAPFTRYAFKVSAVNAAGKSHYSAAVVVQTPAAAPSGIEFETFASTATEVTMSWRQADANGSAITHYNIYCAEHGAAEFSITSTGSPLCEFSLGELKPKTLYKFKVQAVNACGAGPYSPSTRWSTIPLPPRPPRLECTGAGHNFLKLRWLEETPATPTEAAVFDLQMYNARAKKYLSIYEGSQLTFKVNKLQEQCDYQFRIGAQGELSGKGDFSEEYTFRTAVTVPSSMRSPRCKQQDHGLLVEWQHSRNAFADPVEYVLQMQQRLDQDFRKVYRGFGTHYKLDKVIANAQYGFRVCPVRVHPTNGDVYGAYSLPVRHTVLAAATSAADASAALLADHSDTVDGSVSAAAFARGSSAGVGHSKVAVNGVSLTTLMAKCKRMSDQEKATAWAIVFVVGTIALALIVKLIMNAAVV